MSFFFDTPHTCYFGEVLNSRKEFRRKLDFMISKGVLFLIGIISDVISLEFPAFEVTLVLLFLVLFEDRLYYLLA